MKTSYKLITASVAAVACSVGIIGPAFADPARPYAAVGSDTIQDVWNGLTNDSTAVAPSIASYNATSGGASYQLIQTKTGGDWFSRPNGSGDGAKALSAAWDPGYTSQLWNPTGSSPATLNHQDVDFSRSSSGPNAGTGLLYQAFARDAVSVAYYKQTGMGAGMNFTTGELKELYSGVDDTSDSVVTFDGSGNPLVNGQPVHVLIPQQSSGTRKFFLGAIGVTTLASYISDPAAPGGIPENNGTPLDTAGDIIPFSAAQWISQNTGKAINTLNSNLDIATINGKTAVTGTGASSAPGALFGTKNLSGDYTDTPGSGAGVFERDTYTVYPLSYTQAGNTAKQSTLVSILTGTGAGQIGSTNAKAIIRSYGFGTLSYFGGSSSPAQKPGAFQH
jgi:hypothetical protein